MRERRGGRGKVRERRGGRGKGWGERERERRRGWSERERERERREVEGIKYWLWLRKYSHD